MTAVERLDLEGEQLEYRFAGGAAPHRGDLVMLHEGLGSVAMWKDFPEQLAGATGCRVLAYSRLGYGGSSPLRRERAPDYMHEEARRWLPALLARLGIRRPLLFGHSDGASIALIHAAGPAADIAGIVALAPHVNVESMSLTGIARAKVAYETTDLRGRLAPYHEDVDAAFWGWNRIWLSPAFRGWNIEGLLPGIRAPVLAIQGRDDEYASLEQIESIRRALPATELLVLDNCRHSPHRDRPTAVLEATRRFTTRLGGLGAGA